MTSYVKCVLSTSYTHSTCDPKVKVKHNCAFKKNYFILLFSVIYSCQDNNTTLVFV